MDNINDTIGLQFAMRCCILLTILGFPDLGHCFWPAPYRVDLKEQKTFVISAGEDDDDDAEDNEESENEMIRPEDLLEIEELANDESRYKPLHSHVEHYNRRAAEAAKKHSLSITDESQTPMEELNLSNEEIPFIAGFKHELDEYNFNPLGKSNEIIAQTGNNSTSSNSGQRSNREIDEKSSLKKLRSVEGKKRKRSKRDEDDEDILNFDEKTGSDLVESMSPRNHSLELEQEGHGTPHPMDLDNISRNVSESDAEEYEDEKTSLSYDRVTPYDDKSSDVDQPHKERGNIFKDNELTTVQPEVDEIEEEVYDYENFRAEYEQQLEIVKSSNTSYNYTDSGEPEETPKDAIKKIVEFKMPKNCTEEELTKFGIKAFECLAFDYQNAKNESDVRKIMARTWTVVKVWICIYVSIAVPCWCQKGWCCCCFRCSICFPNERILIAKDYYAHNEPGILVDQPGKKGTKSQPVKYKPTLFEIDAYEDFESAIRNL